MNDFQPWRQADVLNAPLPPSTKAGRKKFSVGISKEALTRKARGQRPRRMRKESRLLNPVPIYYVLVPRGMTRTNSARGRGRS